MKVKNLLFAASILTMTACSNDSDTLADGSVALKVNANINGAVATRMYETTFDVNDAIGVFVENTAASSTSVGDKETLTAGSNVKYVTTDKSKFSAATGVTPIYFKDTKTANISAYYPYSSSVSASSRSVSATTSNQSFAGKKTFDFLYGTTTGTTASTKGIDLQFYHKMAKVTFNFKSGNGVDPASLKAGLTQYKVEGLVLDGTFNTSTGVAATSADAKAAAMTVSIADTASVVFNTQTLAQQKTASAIIFPQGVTSMKVTLTYNNILYSATVSLPKDGFATGKDGFAAGYNYLYNITLNQTGLVVSSSQIVGWSNYNQSFNSDAGYDSATATDTTTTSGNSNSGATTK